MRKFLIVSIHVTHMDAEGLCEVILALDWAKVLTQLVKVSDKYALMFQRF